MILIQDENVNGDWQVDACGIANGFERTVVALAVVASREYMEESNFVARICQMWRNLNQGCLFKFSLCSSDNHVCH